ncbi:phage terminase large subunit [Clostridium magnum DSM 2767]|uniref:Phage terminase large subunit n=1 Tax=Clostridium magnum DSM 2767 TaxID=1121326 RepID=A0A162QM65_9CLOT|nr:phage terminase large subunit [Clostridium magnum DSM 2767]SHJ44505.1 Phage terminase, large subunit GpA [Clostridium magnum DSM 2767]
MVRKKIQKIQNRTIKLFRDIAKVLAPPPKLTVSEWADNYRKLSSEASAEPGQWRTSRAPYQKEIMDSINDPTIETIIVMSSAQVGKTELLLNVIGYFMDYDPAPILLLQPTLEMAEAFSKDRLAPMLRDTPVLKNKVGDIKSKNSGNTLLHKIFPGGHITLAGANSPSSLASRPIRTLLCDEVDRYPISAGTEGDPVNLAAKRTTTFWNKKKIYVSTPTIKGASRIESEYEDSTMEEWCLPCPYCGKLQPLTWGQIRFDDATMECLYCRERSTEAEWKSGKGEWRAKSTHRNKRGFHLNELSSPWKRWSEIIEDFREAKKNSETLKVWVNTSLGESWEEQGEKADEETLMKRRERYNSQLPEDVLILTAGVDTQDDRLEVEVVGWGVGKESWGIEYKVFYGDPSQTVVWNELDEYLSRVWKHENGEGLVISCTCIDSGGHHTSEVYKFCKTREHRRIFAVKGKGGDGIPFVGKASRTNREKVALFMLGVDQGKETLLSRLKLDFEGEGYCHFPIEGDRGYDEAYFKGLTSEKRTIKYYKGKPKVEWVKKSGTRNEPLDLRNYATAALEILNPNLELLKNQLKNSNINSKNSITSTNNGMRRRRVISKGL